MVEAALGIVVGGLVLAFAVVLIRFNSKRVHVIRAAARASDEQLESVYRLVEACGSEKPAGCILGRTNRKVADTGCVTTIPERLEDFPWAGRSIAVTAGHGVCQPDRRVALSVLDQPVCWRTP